MVQVGHKNSKSGVVNKPALLITTLLNSLNPDYMLKENLTLQLPSENTMKYH